MSATVTTGAVREGMVSLSGRKLALQPGEFPAAQEQIDARRCGGDQIAEKHPDRLTRPAQPRSRRVVRTVGPGLTVSAR